MLGKGSDGHKGKKRQNRKVDKKTDTGSLKMKGVQIRQQKYV